MLKKNHLALSNIKFNKCKQKIKLIDGKCSLSFFLKIKWMTSSHVYRTVENLGSTELKKKIFKNKYSILQLTYWKCILNAEL